MPFTGKNWVDEANHAGPPAAPPGTPLSGVGMEDAETRLSDYTDEMTGYYSIVNFGAVGDDLTDNQATIAATIGSAQADDVAVYVPPGRFRHSGTLCMTSTTMFGHGSDSVLIATTGTASVLNCFGTATQVLDMAFEGPTALRRNINNAGAVQFSSVVQGRIQGIHIDGCEQVGIMVDDSSYCRIANNYVSNTMADGIHQTNASHHNIVTGNVVKGVGDDSIAVVSYLTDGDYCRDISIVGNNVSSSTPVGRGISVVGGARVTITGNVVENVPNAGIIVTADGTYESYGVQDVTVIGNTLKATEQGGLTAHRGIHVLGYTNYWVDRVLISGNTVDDCDYGGIFTGIYTRQVLVEGNSVSTVNTGSGIEASGGNNISVMNNVFRDIDTYGAYFGTAVDGVIRCSGNTFIDVNTANTAGVDVIHVAPSSSANFIQIKDNYYEHGTGTVNRLVECNNSKSVIMDNYSTDASIVVYQTSTPPIHTGGNPSTPREIYYPNAPADGTWTQGDRVWNSAPTAGGTLGWVCTANGTPGTWKAYGGIAA